MLVIIKKDGVITNQAEFQNQKDAEEFAAKFKNEQVEFSKLPYQELRVREYPKTEELIVALWEQMVESNLDSVNKLQQKRNEIKQKYPKD